MSVILASGSPRRRELFGYVVPYFEVKPVDADEALPDNILPENAAEYLAVKKAAAAAEIYPNNTIVGCDTVVIADGKVLGKPVNAEHASEMLHMLSGKTHKVITGVCIISGGKKIIFSEETAVEFYPLSDDEIAAYVATGDPMDKAGAYGIQSEGCVLVKSIQGDFFNVVGLPVARLKRVLAEIAPC